MEEKEGSPEWLGMFKQHMGNHTTCTSQRDRYVLVNSCSL